MAGLKFVPIRYVGKKEVFKDHLYNSGLTWEKGDFQNVPGYLVSKFLKHPEFQDARTGKLKSAEIDATPPKVELENDEPPLVDLSSLTKDNIVQYAKRNFNMDISGMNKPNMIDMVRRQMGTDMPLGY